MFITFEGPDGSGKTTQIKKVTSFLQEKGFEVVTTREPGGCDLANKIRALLLQRDGGDWQKMSEVLLLFAARLEHIETVIKPALATGKIVLSDRFSDSTYAYQGYGHDLDLKDIEMIEKTSINNFKPDLTCVLDIDVKKGLDRTNTRFDDTGDNDGKTEDRYERMALDFHERLRQGYLEIAKNDPKRCKVIDADRLEEDIFISLIEVLTPYLEKQKGDIHVSA